MISKLVSYLLICLAFYNSYNLYKKNPELIKFVYFRKLIDYIWSLVLVIGVILSIVFLIDIGMPEFLKFSWLNLFGSTGQNLITSGISTTEGIFNVPKFLYKLIPLSVFSILCFCLPYLAKSEEEIFRAKYFTVKDRIRQSLFFGFSHMIVGVPLFIAIILSFVGYIYSIRYVMSYNNNIRLGIDSYNSNENAIDDATSLHAKYNLIILLIAITLIIII